VAQLNLYVPDGIAEDLRSRAKASGKSLSGFVLDMIQATNTDSHFDWDQHFDRLDRAGAVSLEITNEDRYFGDLRDINLS